MIEWLEKPDEGFANNVGSCPFLRMAGAAPTSQVQKSVNEIPLSVSGHDLKEQQDGAALNCDIIPLMGN